MKLNIIENKFNANMYYFTSPNELALAISNPKLITTFWDFGHKQLHRDPDTSTITSRLKRNYYYKNAINRSSKIITDSKSTSKLISKYYSFPNKRIIIVGLPVPKSIKLATRKDIISLTKDMKYIIYPATNWDHKNHNFLLKVFVKLIDKEPNLKLVLCGTRVKQKTSLEELISKYGLEKNVIDLGYLNKPYVNYLIKKSVLLVMPTKLGPTNYPVFESAALGKRSVISQVHEKEAIKEIVNYVTIVQGWNPNKWVSLIRRDMKKRISNNPLRVKNEKIDHLLSSAIFTNHNI
jgi:glycosyltransferase involved in cell wall biosynthesis